MNANRAHQPAGAGVRPDDSRLEAAASTSDQTAPQVGVTEGPEGWSAPVAASLGKTEDDRGNRHAMRSAVATLRGCRIQATVGGDSWVAGFGALRHYRGTKSDLGVVQLPRPRNRVSPTAPTDVRRVYPFGALTLAVVLAIRGLYQRLCWMTPPDPKRTFIRL